MASEDEFPALKRSSCPAEVTKYSTARHPPVTRVGDDLAQGGIRLFQAQLGRSTPAALFLPLSEQWLLEPAGIQRQCEIKARPAPYLTPGPHPAAMALHDMFHNGKA